MAFLNIYLYGGITILVFMTLLWIASLVLRNSSIVDIFWGPGFVIATWIYFGLTPEGFLLRKLMICLLVTIWGLRLSYHILMRNWGKPEDFRYQAWRKQAGVKWWWQSFIRVFLLQGILLWIISAPLLGAQNHAAPAYLTGLDFAAVLIWLVGFFFEAFGDWQLASFKANPANKGKVMNQGVWRYTRHPNYFGDAAQLWGYYLFALAAGSYWTIFSPILMTLLLVKVSGVALLEKTLKETRPGYKEYIETTSSFVPWFPRRK